MYGNVRQWFPRFNPVVALPFIFTINTNNTITGSSTSTQFKLPLVGTGTYDFTVDWGDSSSDNITVYDAGAITHTYLSAGTYTVTISGVCTGWSFEGGGDRLKILDILQWGILRFINTSFSNFGFFRLCSNMQVTATDTPYFTGCTEVAGMFRQCTALIGNSSFNDWDISGLTNIAEMFLSCPNFNANIENWNVSNVTNFNGALQQCTIFNQNINSWNVGSGTNFINMFQGANAFNQPLNSWNVSNAISMQGMLRAAAFNQPLNLWDVSKVKTFGASNNGMFYQAFSFNQDISMWNTSSATSMQQMFRNAGSFRGDISGWDFSNLTGTNAMESFMFGNNGWGTVNYDAFLISAASQALKSNITASFGTNKYSAGAAATARANIIANFNWTIADGGQV